jgi:hypothetical protein
VNITQTNRNKLFYNKFCYRVVLKYPGVRFVSNTRDLVHFKQKINNARKNNSTAWYKLPVPKLTELNLDLCEKLIGFYSNYSCNKEVTFLHDHLSLSVYTSNIDILKELYQIDNNIEITQALPAPPAVMYFAKDPKFAYRVYLKGIRVTESLVSDLRDFSKRYEYSHDIQVCSALKDYVNSNRWGVRYYNYLTNNYFINYNDPSTLTLMHLLFNECLGKNYKLEKRP